MRARVCMSPVSVHAALVVFLPDDTYCVRALVVSSPLQVQFIVFLFLLDRRAVLLVSSGTSRVRRASRLVCVACYASSKTVASGSHLNVRHAWSSDLSLPYKKVQGKRCYGDGTRLSEVTT